MNLHEFENNIISNNTGNFHLAFGDKDFIFYEECSKRNIVDYATFCRYFFAGRLLVKF